MQCLRGSAISNNINDEDTRYIFVVWEAGVLLKSLLESPPTWRHPVSP